MYVCMYMYVCIMCVCHCDWFVCAVVPSADQRSLISVTEWLWHSEYQYVCMYVLCVCVCLCDWFCLCCSPLRWSMQPGICHRMAVAIRALVCMHYMCVFVCMYVCMYVCILCTHVCITRVCVCVCHCDWFRLCCSPQHWPAQPDICHRMAVAIRALVCMHVLRVCVNVSVVSKSGKYIPM